MFIHACGSKATCAEVEGAVCINIGGSRQWYYYDGETTEDVTVSCEG